LTYASDCRIARFRIKAPRTRRPAAPAARRVIPGYLRRGPRLREQGTALPSAIDPGKPSRPSPEGGSTAHGSAMGRGLRPQPYARTHLAHKPPPLASGWSAMYCRWNWVRSRDISLPCRRRHPRRRARRSANAAATRRTTSTKPTIAIKPIDHPTQRLHRWSTYRSGARHNRLPGRWP
jgi:hypothetical protein